MNKNAVGTMVLAGALLAGCSVIDKHERVAGWPDMKVIEHHVPHAEMRDRCSRFVSVWSTPEGCTLFYFDKGEAHIYVSAEFPVAWVLRHERLHALGYDHVGSRNMQRAVERWRAQQHASSPADAEGSACEAPCIGP